MTEAASLNASEGIYAYVTFGQSPQLNKFLKDLPVRIGDALHPADVHATAMYPQELTAAGLAATDIDKLPEVLRRVRHDLPVDEIIGHEVNLVQNVIRPYKRHQGLEIVDCPEIDLVRRTCAEAVLDILGIDLGSCLDDQHVSVARRQKNDGCRKLISYEKNFPKSLTIAGIHIENKQVILEAAKTTSYVNGGSRNHCMPGRSYS